MNGEATPPPAGAGHERWESPVQHESTAVATSAARLHQPNSGCLTYTVHEAAALAGVSVDSYYRALKAGIVPGRKIGGRWVVSRVKLERYLEGED